MKISRFKIQLNNAQVSECIDVIVRNNLGTVVHTEFFENKSGRNSIEIEVGVQPKGIYFVEIKNGKNCVIKKLLKE